MTLEDLSREILINRVFLIILFLGGGMMFAFTGVLAWWSVRMVRRPLAEFNLLVQMLLRRMKEYEAEPPPKRKRTLKIPPP